MLSIHSDFTNGTSLAFWHSDLARCEILCTLKPHAQNFVFPSPRREAYLIRRLSGRENMTYLKLKPEILENLEDLNRIWSSMTDYFRCAWFALGVWSPRFTLAPEAWRAK